MTMVPVPTLSQLVKLGSIARHVEEALSSEGHVFDLNAIAGLLKDEELQELMAAMDALALLPVKRS